MNLVPVYVQLASCIGPPPNALPRLTRENPNPARNFRIKTLRLLRCENKTASRRPIFPNQLAPYGVDGKKQALVMCRERLSFYIHM